MSTALIKSTSLVSSMTLLSRVLGFARDMIVASFFGVNAEMDAFLIAFKLPNFMRALFAEGAFSQAFVPALARYRTTQTFLQTRAFIAAIGGTLGFVLLIITGLGLLAMPWIVKGVAFGLDPHRFELAVYLSRITFGYLLFISLAAFTGSVLNSTGNFWLPAAAPGLLNICLILAAFWGHTFFFIPVESLAWGVLIAGILQWVVLLPVLKKQGFFVKPCLNFQNTGVKSVLKQMLPALFGASIVQIGILINTLFASFLPTGSVSWLYYSERLAYFPQGVFGVALATVALPYLSRHAASQAHDKFSAMLNTGLRMSLFIGLPASVILYVLSGPLIATLFKYHHFSAHDVIMTQQSVKAYAIGLQAFMLIKLLSTGFYARSDIRTPVYIGILTLVLNSALNVLFMPFLKHAGLALATSLSSFLNCFLLIYFLKKKSAPVFFRWEIWTGFLGRLIIANGLMGYWLYKAQADLNSWLIWDAKNKAWHLFYLLLTAFLIYILTLFLSGLKLKHVISAHGKPQKDK